MASAVMPKGVKQVAADSTFARWLATDTAGDDAKVEVHSHTQQVLIIDHLGMGSYLWSPEILMWLGMLGGLVQDMETTKGSHL